MITFHRWLANQGGWSHAEEQKRAGGEKGSKVHQAARVLLEGGTVSLIDLFENPTTNEPEELNAAEYSCLMSLCDWYNDVRPEIIGVEFTVWNERYRYAGTVDIYCKIGRSYWIIDMKVSSDVWPAHEIQLSAYKHSSTQFPPSTKLAVLQLGYKRNKTQKWKFTQVADQFGLFLATRKIWEKETSGVKAPLQRDYPESLSLNPVEIHEQEIAVQFNS